MNILDEKIKNCQNCVLCKTRNKVVIGEGSFNADIMFVGEAPGKVNNECGRPFVGHGGKIFDKLLSKVGLSRQNIYITNVIKCWPPENRKPKKIEITSCKDYLFRQIQIINPSIIIALGATAFETLTDKKIKIKENCGKVFCANNLKIGLCFHPNALRYIKGGMASLADDLHNIFNQI